MINLTSIEFSTAIEQFKTYSANECLNYCVESATAFYNNDIGKFFLCFEILAVILIFIKLNNRHNWITHIKTVNTLFVLEDIIPYVILLTCFYFFLITK